VWVWVPVWSLVVGLVFWRYHRQERLDRKLRPAERRIVGGLSVVGGAVFLVLVAGFVSMFSRYESAGYVGNQLALSATAMIAAAVGTVLVAVGRNRLALSPRFGAPSSTRPLRTSAI
jgi:hypothetical protein